MESSRRPLQLLRRVPVLSGTPSRLYPSLAVRKSSPQRGRTTKKNKRGAPSFLPDKNSIASYQASRKDVPLIKFICCAPRTSPWAAYFLDNHFIAYKLLEYTTFRQPAVRLTVNPCPRTSVRFVSVSAYYFIHSVSGASFRAPPALNIALST